MSGRVLSSALKCASVGCAVGLTYGVVRGFAAVPMASSNAGIFESYKHIYNDSVALSLVSDLSTYRVYDIDTFETFVKYYNMLIGVQQDRSSAGKTAGRSRLAQFYSTKSIDALRVLRKRIESLSPELLDDTDALYKKLQKQVSDCLFNVTMQQMSDMDR